MQFTPIGRVVGGRAEAVEDHWRDTTAVIRLDGDRFTTAAVVGLDEYSHLEVVFGFDRIDPDAIRVDTPRPARGNPEWPPVGVFAHRGPFRPNRIGVSRCRLIEVDGLDLHIADLDALDGTPVFDVKPYIREFGVHTPVRQPEWATALMREYYEPA
ncbi:tRNA-Thr(GGU) m(6)t(6)A37 methyltransferase TsaA [Stackebrandtia albiflava]|uniref:tRNA-Thr(GGU) m(6)t(6)A37 methyltransferase TsaA n=1 Tax=Stackebrandtia albiflava TaxID=406432 RepID=A0A562V9A6_9ACTN|nr:SAM-dependent methyltransferase [Stackebrandtia albiflava]TWJ14485.1 tRNA-Thr(GGU) m(6)t(6)A37 methyltransferase TsaA [Stackebrandtia albiflava]